MRTSPAPTTTPATGPRTRQLVAAALVAAVLVGAGGAAAGTLRLGRGLPPWKLGQRYVLRTGLVRTERYPENAGTGCVTGVGSATRLDFYRGVRVAWHPGLHGRLYLIDVATSRAGDRSGDGFVIGHSRLAAVRHAHAQARIAYGKGPFSLGARSLTVVRRSGEEGFATLVYWFDARGVLTALETFAGGC